MSGMGIVQMAGVALLSVALILLIKELRPTLSLPLRLAASLVLFGGAIALFAPILAKMQGLFALSGGEEYASLLLRATGVALLCELTASFCRDLGEGTVALGVQTFGKLEILLLCLPLLDDVMEMAKELLKI